MLRYEKFVYAFPLYSFYFGLKTERYDSKKGSAIKADP